MQNGTLPVNEILLNYKTFFALLKISCPVKCLICLRTDEEIVRIMKLSYIASVTNRWRLFLNIATHTNINDS